MPEWQEEGISAAWSQFLYQLVKSSSGAVLVGNEEDVQEPVRHAVTGCHQDCG